jgi:hypothetical protein
MHRPFRNAPRGAANQSPRSREYQSFLKAVFGIDLSSGSDEETKAREERAKLEWPATISTRHEVQLRLLLNEEAKAARDRENLEWVASITEPEWGDRSDIPLSESTRAFVDAITGPEMSRLCEGGCDPAKHPRGGYPQNRGWWSPASGGGGPILAQRKLPPGKYRTLLRRDIIGCLPV